MTTSLTTPISEQAIRQLKLGETVELNGIMVTARDMAHKCMVEEHPDFVREYLKEGLIYHCGPVVKQDNGVWSFVAAGPTTSTREEPYQADVIREYTVRGVIGKGGMGDRTLEGLQEVGACYFHTIGGLGTLLAQCAKKVITVFKLEDFGTPEAFWVVEVEKFPAVVTMDAHGNSLHKEILEKSQAIAKTLY